MNFRRAVVFMGLLLTIFALPLRAHILPIYPVKVELKVDQGLIRARIEANASNWNEILQANPPLGEWPKELKARAESYFNSHFILRLDEKPLEGNVVDARYSQEPWQDEFEARVVFFVTYPLPAGGHTLSGRADFYKEEWDEIEGTGKKTQGVTREFVTLLSVPGKNKLKLALTLEKQDFSWPLEDFRRTKSKLWVKAFNSA